MSASNKKNKRPHSSTNSEFESNTSTLDQSVFEDRPENPKKKNKSKKKQKGDDPLQSTMDEFVKSKEKDTAADSKINTIEKKIDIIGKTLSKMLTKDDTSFIKDLVKTVVEEMKDHLLTSVVKRLDILEGENHERSLEIEHYKKEIEAKDRQISSLKEENKELQRHIRTEEMARRESLNDLEQHGRRNSVRISGIPDDADKQQSDAVEKLVVKNINENTDLNLKREDIDITHRLGTWEIGKSRAVIVKFVRRQTKINLMKCAKTLRKNKVYVNEDLTRINQQVLASLRLKDPDNVSKCWSFEGKLYVMYKDSTRPTEVKFKDYETWLSKPWPPKKTVPKPVSTETTHL